MAVLIVPPLDLSYPTLGPAIADFIHERAVFGPGSLAGLPAELDADALAAIYRLYEVYPRGHRLEGRRRFSRGAFEWRKGMAKTEKAAWIAYAELHPEAPVRCDGFDANGDPVGRPVTQPYIPMMAVTEEQVSELAYGVLKYVVEEGPDSHLFDSSLDRILRLDHRGRPDGRAVPVSNSPGSRDGALTTFQHFDEPHRLVLPSAKNAHETMSANLTKRPLEDPWALYTSTAGAPGEQSIEEDVRAEAELIDRGEVKNPALFFFARWAGDEHKDLMPRAEAPGIPEVTHEQAMSNRIAAIAEATGPVGEFGPGQFESIAKQWDRPRADTAYLERVWLNRWRRSNSQFFDSTKLQALAKPGERIPLGAFISLGFDGARFRDATAIVATDIKTGMQELMGLWERPENVDDWEVPEDEVTATFERIMKKYRVHKLFADPPHWTETIGSWYAKYPDQVEEFYTKRHQMMAYTLREYEEAIASASISFGGVVDPEWKIGEKLSPHDDLLRHLGNAGKKQLRMFDDEGQPLYVMQKQDGQMGLKFDAGMAAVLSWKARLDAIKGGAKPKSQTRKRAVIRKLNPRG
ncbi:large terminase [Leucobacter sp. cx-42]|uniref:large terminase n=1 Tax=unclassified Leucobacter TaxID=2621730 RepID=UPI00165D988E|nr:MULTISPECIES: large terminase [unclassified Leucobacter]MBC9954935.1 large terminase [Leucobacter sp. cx-42]